MDKQLRQDITETILRRAVIANYEREMAEIPSNEELSKICTFTAAHEARMRALFKKAERKEVLGRIFYVSKRAAVVLLVAATVLFSALLTDSRVQASIRNTIISWYERFTLFRFQGESATEGTEWYPNFIPEGFEVEETIDLYHGRHTFFLHPDGRYIIFDYTPAEGTIIGVDNEYTELTNVIIDGTEYFVLTPIPGSEHHAQVIWRTNDMVFILISGLDSETLLEIALSVALVG